MNDVKDLPQHTPGHVPELPALSPLFISADDAANWAHQQPRRNTGMEYGALILKRPDGKFVATMPILGQKLGFDYKALLEADADNFFMHPRGYTCHGLFHSHPALRQEFEKANPSFSVDQIKLFISFFSGSDIMQAYRRGDFASINYLSGPYGSLIKNEVRLTEQSKNYAHWLLAIKQQTPAISGHGDDRTPEGIVRKLASLWDVRVLIPGAVFQGLRGRITEDWQPFEPVDSSEVTELPLCGPIFSQARQAVEHALSQQGSTDQRGGFVLKRADLEEYVATEAMLLTSLNPTASRLFPLAASLWPLLPAQHFVEGWYCAAPLTKAAPVPLQPWLYGNFFSPQELAEGIAQSRRLKASIEPGKPLSVYRRTRDGALLRYRFSFSAQEELLYSVTPAGQVTDNGIQGTIMSAQLSPKAFIQQVAAAGELTVLEASNVWDKVGAVTPAWRPFSKIPVPVLSPAFITAADAARWAHEAIGARRDVEYGGVILKRGNRYYATEPLPDQHESFDHGLLLAKDSEGNFIAPDDYSAEAFYHSHPANATKIREQFRSFTPDQVQLFNNFYSVADQLFSFKQRAFAKTHYFSGPDNVLLKYVSSGSALEKTWEQQLRTGTVEASSDFENMIWKLAEAGELSVLIGHGVWGGVCGQVKKGWRINTPVTLGSAVLQQPFFTSVFPTSEMAVLSALLTSGPLDAGAMGFVLKHTREDVYVATLAVPKTQPLFSPNKVFPERPGGKLRLPSNFRLAAIYFRSWYENDEVAAREKWLASTFFTPAQVVAAARQARATLDVQDSARGLSLYMHASDGALLTFKVPEVTAMLELVGQKNDGELDDNGAQAALAAGTLSPRTYVRRVIAATDLSVVQAGGLWRRVGGVDNRSDLLTSFYTVTLSRSFLSARDAAVYAHERIGTRRDRYYGGYVLKGEDGRFVITEPMESAANPFAFTLFFPRDNQGPLIPPEPYVLQGRYGSHTALSMIDPDWVARRRWTRDEAQTNLQVFSDDEMYSIIPAGRVTYLSGARDCLLEYTPNNSPEERILLANIGPHAGDNSLGKRLDSGQIRPLDWVRRLAQAGDFKIILGNPLWGPRSVVYSDWTPSFDYAPRSGAPTYATYGAVFASADEAARNLHGRVHARNFAEPACFAFILKRRDQEQYIASEVVGVSQQNKLFNLNSLFEPKAEGGYRLPDGFVLHGLFRSQQWSPAGLNTSYAWLTLFFITPEVLYVALYEANRSGVTNLPIYCSTLDGALLRYVPSPVDVKAGGPAETLLTQAQEELNSGKKTPSAFVREWALRGRLHVIRTSQCWDKKGVVATTWTGYETLAPRRLSPAFSSPDDAARHAAALVGNGHRRRYGGVILRLGNRLFASTNPLAIPPQGLALHWIYPEHAAEVGLYPGGSTIVARYRSEVDQEVPLLLSSTQKSIYKSMIPSAVLSNLLHREAHIKREYVFGANGSILSYELSGTEEERQLKSRLGPLNLAKGDYGDNGVEQQLRSGALSPQAFITEVAKAGKLYVIEGDQTWGQPRQITANFVPNQFRPNAGDIRQVFFDSPCGPIFTRALDAVRYAQRAWKPHTDVAFGYVLKSVNKPLYMTTLALVRDNLADFEQVFVDGQLPQGYVLDGLYLCASTVAIASAEDEMARSFLPPQYLAKALNFMTSARNVNVLPLYVACSDGALLTYVFPKTASLSDWTRTAHLDRTHLLEGTLTVRDYVRRLAGAGELSIRVTSDVWGRKERVTAEWVPKKAPHAFADDPRLHSFCGPLFLYPDDAARYAEGLVAPFSTQQYLGAVLVPGLTQGYVALDPVEDQGTGDTSTLQLLFWIDHAGFDVPDTHELKTYKISAVQAFYKTIASTSSLEQIDISLLANFVSKDDLRDYVSVIKSNFPDAKSCYLSCRGGALLKYVPAFTEAETRVLAPGAAPDPRVLVNQLRGQGSLSVLVTDAFWTRLGVLGEEWNISEVQAELEAEEFWYSRTRDEL
ncbi:DUF4329 domain-containing protein [Pseudomonas sp. D47]|uniref:DUF4329 domain-containing protein n=1 Tax=Pseudomonas sp. D47 TaxID=3159447 RepID=UPI00387B505E